MLLPAVFASIDNALEESRKNEILACGPLLKMHGLVLKASDAASIIAARNHALRTHGRIDLDISVTKKFMTAVAPSPYVTQDNYVGVINELYEFFQFLKNNMSDLVGDEEIIQAIIIYFNDYCRGSTEYLMGKGIELILQNYRENRDLCDISREEAEVFWIWYEQEHA